MRRRDFLKAALAGTLAAVVGGMAKQLDGPLIDPASWRWRSHDSGVTFLDPPDLGDGTIDLDLDFSNAKLMDCKGNVLGTVERWSFTLPGRRLG